MSEGPNPDKPKRRQTRFLKRHIVSSDNHTFVGRIYDLSIISLHFDTYDQLARFPDCKYAFDTNHWVSNLVTRVESLNLVGDMLWPEPMPQSFKEMPVSRHQWLTITTDVFLIRYVSVLDCALLLTNQVFEAGIPARECTIRRFRKAGLPANLMDHLQVMLDEQEEIRRERNSRIHHGSERCFTDDDQTFRTASLFNDKFNGIVGKDIYGRKIDVNIAFREGLVGLQKDFNSRVRQLEKQLDQLYSYLFAEFERRFRPLIASATHGLNAKSKARGSISS